MAYYRLARQNNNFAAHTFVLSKQSVLEIALMLHSHADISSKEYLVLLLQDIIVYHS